MNKCGRIRDLIDDAVSMNDRRMPEEAECHIEGCEECRKYLSAALRDDERFSAMAASMEESIRRVERGVGDSLSEMKRTQTAGVRASCGFNPFRTGGRTEWARLFKPLAAVAAVVLVLWAFSGRLGPKVGSTDLFATALRNAVSAENVTYRETMQIDGVDYPSVDVSVNRAGVFRSEFESGDVVIHDLNNGLKLQIFGNSDRAELTRSVGRSSGKRQFNYVKWLSGLHATSGTFVGCERIDGKEAHRYNIEGEEYHASKVWVDPEVNLPIQIEHLYKKNIDSTIVVPKIALSLRDFGGNEDLIRTYSISSPGMGIQQMIKMLATGMAWNVELDDSLFSFESPKGHIVVEREKDDSFDGEENLVEALSAWVKLSGGNFPEEIGDLADSAVVNGLLIAAYNGDKDPNEELDEAMKAANILLKGLFFAMELKIEGEWAYDGGGARPGDANRPVCWFRYADAQDYRVVYGDLRIVDARADELPRRPKPAEHD